MAERPTKEPDSLAVRSKRHRERRRNLETQLAVAIAKLATGQTLGDHRLVLKEYISRFARPDAVPDDQLKIIDMALDRLNSSQFRR